MNLDAVLLRGIVREQRVSAVAALLMLTVFILPSCRTKREPHGESGAAVTVSAEDRCVDAWLAQRHLDAFGAPEGTAYAGGTPLLDESTGEGKSRSEYVYARHPAARGACAPEAGSR